MNAFVDLIYYMTHVVLFLFFWPIYIMWWIFRWLVGLAAQSKIEDEIDERLRAIAAKQAEVDDFVLKMKKSME